MKDSRIEWTDHTFNPWMGCSKVSPACQNCYAERDFDHRYGKVNWGPSGTRVMTSEANWRKPTTWNAKARESSTRKRVFCASLADVFEDWQGPILNSKGDVVGDDMRAIRRRLFRLIDHTLHLDWLLLPKRPEDIRRLWTGPSRDNVWLGASVENQQFAEIRIPLLLDCADLSPVRFLSCEPLLGDVAIAEWLGTNRINWIIAGGESGPHARPSDPTWFQSLLVQCEAAGVPFHFKQWGEFNADRNRVGKKRAGRLLDGKTHDGLPVLEATQ